MTDETPYETTITVPELNALIRILHEKVHRPVFEPDLRIREETAAVESFMDRAIRAVNAAQEAERAEQAKLPLRERDEAMAALVAAQAEIAALRGERGPLRMPLGEDGGCP